jgi:transcriptional regulator with XRE-family HTH domain
MMYGMAERDLGTRIRLARGRRRWTQQQLAAELGVGVRSVGSWERNETVPRNLGALEQALGASLDEDFNPGEAEAIAEIRQIEWLTRAEQDELIERYRRGRRVRRLAG